MKHVSILVPEGALLGSIEAPYKIFNEANAFCRRSGREAPFHVELVGSTKHVHLNQGIFAVSSHWVIDEDGQIHDPAFKTDIVLMPAIEGSFTDRIEANRTLTAFAVNQHDKGASVASLCVGAFLLASTGLLDGRKCATHWIAAQDFRTMFPNVNLVADQVITDENRIYTSGGAYSHLNLVLYLVEKYAGRDVAVYCAKLFAIDIDRDSQSPFAIFSGQKDHGDAAIVTAQNYIEERYQQRISVDEIASLVSMGRRNLERRFKKATSNTIVEYIQRVKMEAAKIALESTGAGVQEVMLRVGYTDPKAFRNVFRTVTGLSPIEYKNRYNRELPSS